MRRRHTLLAAALALIATYSWPAAGQAPRPTGATVFEGARLITGDGSAPIEDAAFVVENSRITAVGRRGEVAAPAGAAHVDLTGKTAMPAIVDAHGHPGFLDAVTGQLSKANFTRENYIDHLERYAYHGIAATISTGTDMGELAYQLRAEVIPNAALIRTVGLGLAYPGSGPADSSRNDVPYAVTSVAQARKAVQDIAPHKPDFVKIWVDSRNGRQQKLTPEMFTAAADEARQQGLRSIAHVFDLVDANPGGNNPRARHSRNRPARLVRRAAGARNHCARADPRARPNVRDAQTRGHASAAGVRRHQCQEAPCRRRAAGARQRRRRRRQPLARAAHAPGVRQHGGGGLHPDGDDRRSHAGFRQGAAPRPARHGSGRQERRFHRARRQSARQHRQCPQDQCGLPQRRGRRSRRIAGKMAGAAAREQAAP